jgi:MFS family permease
LEEIVPTFKPSPQMRRMQIVALLLLVASGIVNYLDRSALSIANIEVRQELNLSATAMGVLLSAFLMSYAFSQLPAGIGGSRGAGLPRDGHQADQRCRFRGPAEFLISPRSSAGPSPRVAAR